MEVCLAHLTNASGERKEQSLREHCINTAEYAAECIGSVKLYYTVYLSGLLHDAGKAKAEFAEYLEEAFEGCEVKRGSVNHTFAGVIWLLENHHRDSSSVWEKLTSEIIGYAVGAHHGLFDCFDLDGRSGFLYRLQKDRKELHYEEAMHNFFAQVANEGLVEDYFHKAVKEVEEFFADVRKTYGPERTGQIFFQISMMVRLVVSAVVYGDRRDTCEFMSQKGQFRTQGEDPGWESRRKYYEDRISRMDSSSALNQVRADISRQCLEAAERSSGIYRLNVPTGAGKTLCTLRYALAHAERYHRKRIIFIIPLLSVLDQNVKVIRDYLPNGREVLEHHSNVVREIMENREQEAEDPAKTCEFLDESWNAPVVVSTLVQLLNILFSHQTTAAGRMQALCDSVIVIDEVQSLPGKMTAMFNMAMNFLQQYCNASIVLSSATQPCFEELQWPLRLADHPDMVSLNPEQLQIFRRAEILDRTDRHGMDWEQCTEFCGQLAQQYSSLLVICNTKSEARILYEKLQIQAADPEWNIRHLSTSMCQEHRLEVLEEIKKDLKELQEMPQGNHGRKRCICISTQLIEAGVDISFQCVVRILAGVDSLAQAAGRCNRSNEYGQTGKVYLIKLKNENLSMLKEIENARKSTMRVLEDLKGTEDSLIGEQATRQFYRYLFQERENQVKYPIEDYGTTLYLADLLSNKNGSVGEEDGRKYILYQPFLTIGKAFKVFDQETIDVVVPHGKGSDWIEQLRIMQKGRFDMDKFREIMEQIKKYTVSIYEWQLKKLDQAGMLESILEGRILALNPRAYDKMLGVTVMEEQPVSNFCL